MINSIKHGRELTELSACRICGDSHLHTVFSLGCLPLANGYLSYHQLEMLEQHYPLEVCFCDQCKLVFLKHVVSPETLFREYSYVTGASNPLITHFNGLAKTIIQRFGVPPKSLVIDIGSNDGTLLKAFKNYDMETVGVEPAANIAKIASSCGIFTLNNYFNKDTAREILEKAGKAKVITATNVFAHVHDIKDFLIGINTLLDDGGILVIEVPYLVDLINGHEFDTIYHEHLSYFMVGSLNELLMQFNLHIIDVERIPVGGGSIRIYANKQMCQVAESVQELITFEKEQGFYNIEKYYQFGQEISLIKHNLFSLLCELKEKEKIIAGYGASAKGTILLNYCNIDLHILDFIVDSTSLKQWLYMPGVHIPIFPEDYFHHRPPDYFLLLVWNFKEAILTKEANYRKQGGKFVLPFPEPHIV